MVILNSIEEMVVKADIAKLGNENEAILSDGVAVVVKFVKRGNQTEDIIMLDDVVERKIDMPILSTDLRKDVYDFFNAAMTNFYNRRFINGLCDIAVTSNGGVDQFRLKIGDYVEDRDVLMNDYMVKDERFTKLLTLTEVYYENSFMDGIKQILAESLVCPKDVIPLVFLYRLDFIKLDGVKLPTSKRLQNGKTLLLLDPDVVLAGLNLNKKTPKHEIVVVTDDNKYLLGRSFNNKVTIRELECGELFNSKIQHYEL